MRHPNSRKSRLHSHAQITKSRLDEFIQLQKAKLISPNIGENILTGMRNVFVKSTAAAIVLLGLHPSFLSTHNKTAHTRTGQSNHPSPRDLGSLLDRRLPERPGDIEWEFRSDWQLSNEDPHLFPGNLTENLTGNVQDEADHLGRKLRHEWI